jgi:hypothetical protein
VSDYGLNDRAIGVRFPAGAKDFSSSLFVQTSSGTHPTSCTMGTGDPFPGAKARPGRDPDHSPHLVPRSSMSRSYTSSPPKRIHGVLWDSFNFSICCVDQELMQRVSLTLKVLSSNLIRRINFDYNLQWCPLVEGTFKHFLQNCLLQFWRSLLQTSLSLLMCES